MSGDPTIESPGDAQGNSFAFKCGSCEHPLVIDKDKPPGDQDIIRCRGCGREFGAYIKVKNAALVLAKAEFDGVIERKFPDIPFIVLSELLPSRAD